MQVFNKAENIANAVSDARSQTWICLSDAHLVDADLDTILNEISHFTHLTEIDLSKNALTDTGIDKLRQFCLSHPNVQTLALNYVPMTEKGAIGLLNVTTVKELLLWNNRQITTSFAQAVLEQSHLTKLDIRDTGICKELILSAHAHVRANAEMELSRSSEHTDEESHDRLAMW